MQEQLKAQCELQSYRLEICEDGRVVKVETFDAATKTRTVEHADGRKEVFYDA